MADAIDGPAEDIAEHDMSDFEVALRQRVNRRVPAQAWPAIAVAVVAGLVVGHLWTSGTAAAKASPGPSPTASHSRSANVLAPPVPGLCHNYSRDAEGADNEESAAVPCNGPHDAVTVAIVDHPDLNLPYVGSYEQASRAMVTCQRAAEHYLGIGPGVTFTRYSSAVYEPDQAQLDAGQRWIRCDLVKFPTYLGLMPLPTRVQGTLRTGPGLEDAFCVQPHAVDEGLPAADQMEAPELGDWGGQADCFGSHALVAVRRGTARSAAGAGASCTAASNRFRGLPLFALVPPSDAWNGQVLCVAHIDAYETWVANGKQLA